MQRPHKTSRRQFIRISLTGGFVLTINPLGLVRAYSQKSSPKARPGSRLEDLIPKDMRWVYAGPDSTDAVLGASDEAQVGVDPDVNNTTARQVTDPNTHWSYSGAPLSLWLNDSTSSTDIWEILAYSDNLEVIEPVQFGHIIGSVNDAPASMGGEIYNFLYRGLDAAGGSSGTVRNFNEQIDRYQSFVTIDYMYDDNGTMKQDKVSFYAPHDVLKHLMGWDEVQFHDYYTINSASDEFVPFFTAMQELIQSPQLENGLEDDLSRLINRMTPSPNPGPNPAYDTLALLDGISQGDVTVHDNMYPVGVTLEMQDNTSVGKADSHAVFNSRRFVRKANALLYKPNTITFRELNNNATFSESPLRFAIPPFIRGDAGRQMEHSAFIGRGSKNDQNKNNRYLMTGLHKPAGIQDVSYDPPMPDATLPTNMQGVNNQNHLGWMHSYLVQCDPGQKPDLSFSGMSDNLQPSWMSEPTGNPDEYLVNVLLQTGDQQSLDNLTINFQQVPDGIEDRRDKPSLPSTLLYVSPNYPEPMNPRTHVDYKVKSATELDISVYDVLGRKVETLYHGRHKPGEFTIGWDAGDLSSGVYFMRFTAPGYVKSERMILSR